MKKLLKRVFNRFLRASNLFRELQMKAQLLEERFNVIENTAVPAINTEQSEMSVSELGKLRKDVYMNLEAIQATQGAVYDCMRQVERTSFLIEHLTKKYNDIDSYLSNEAREKVLNTLKQDQQYLCHQYTSFNKSLATMDNIIPFNGKRFHKSLYPFFIANQEKLSFICQNLDDTSNEILYRQLFLWCATPLIFNYSIDPPPPAWSRTRDLKVLMKVDELLKYRWDYEVDEVSWETHYWLDEQHIREGYYVIDGGAYMGETAVIMDRLVGQTGKVIAFEPGDNAFNYLNRLNLPNTVCIHKGLYGHTGTVSFHIVEGGDHSSSIMEEGENQIKVVSIDEYMSENGTRKIDFIKLDIEGAELSALNGAEKTIEKYKPNLAVSLYHNGGKDLIEVTYYIINKYKDIYDFTLVQNHIGWSETVLMAEKKETI